MTATLHRLPVSTPDPALMGLARAFHSAGMTSATIASWDQPGVPRPAEFQAFAVALDWAEWEASWLATWEELVTPGPAS